MSYSSILYSPGQPAPGYAKATGLDAETTAVLNAQGERNMLAHGIASTAHKLGIYNDQVPLCGPRLLMLLDDIRECYTQPYILEAADAYSAQMQAQIAPVVQSAFADMPAAALGDGCGHFLPANALDARPDAASFNRKFYSEEQVARLLADAQIRMGGNLKEGLLTVDLPDAVVEIIAQHAGITGPFGRDFYQFAQELKDEIVARLPAAVVRPGRPSNDPLLRVAESMFDADGQARDLVDEDYVTAAYALESTHGALPEAMHLWQGPVDALRDAIESGQAPASFCALDFNSQEDAETQVAKQDAEEANAGFCARFPGAVQRLLNWSWAWGRSAGLHRIDRMDAQGDYRFSSLKRGTVVAAQELQAALTLGASENTVDVLAGAAHVVGATPFSDRDIARLYHADLDLQSERIGHLMDAEQAVRHAGLYALGFKRAHEELAGTLTQAAEDVAQATAAATLEQHIPAAARDALAAGKMVPITEMGPEFQQAVRALVESGKAEVFGGIAAPLSQSSAPSFASSIPTSLDTSDVTAGGHSVH